MADGVDAIQADFDRIALLAADQWDHNAHYHRFLLGYVPPGCQEALDIGCGMGAFARLLAGRAGHVLGLDLSPRMVQIARERSTLCPGLAFQVADVTRWEFPTERFDCIASIATLHHLPLDSTLVKIRGALRPGGVLIALDLWQAGRWIEMLPSLAALPLSVLLEIVHNRRLRKPRACREAWAEHAKNDVYPTLAQVQEACGRILPGAQVRRHLLWRYSLIWTKPRGQRVWKKGTPS